MKSFVFLSLLFLFCSPNAHAEMYTWVDEEGVRNYSNTPPPGDISSMEVYEERVIEVVEEVTEETYGSGGVGMGTNQVQPPAPGTKKTVFKTVSKIVYVPVQTQEMSKTEKEKLKNIRRYEEWLKDQKTEKITEREMKHEKELKELELKKAEEERKREEAKARKDRRKYRPRGLDGPRAPPGERHEYFVR